jgi:hypothetical protein
VLFEITLFESPASVKTARPSTNSSSLLQLDERIKALLNLLFWLMFRKADGVWARWCASLIVSSAIPSFGRWLKNISPFTIGYAFLA